MQSYDKKSNLQIIFRNSIINKTKTPFPEGIGEKNT